MKNVVLDLCAYVAHLKEDEESFDVLGRRIPHGMPGHGHGAKRSHENVDAAATTTTKRQKRLSAVRDVKDQYMQGKTITDPEVRGMGCGTCLLYSGLLDSKSPFSPRMKFEIMSGTDDCPSLRLCSAEVEGLYDMPKIFTWYLG